MIKTLNENILGFDPCSQEYKTFIIDVTPKIAKYILENHNQDNRKIVMSQVKTIARSIHNDGWLEDGQPLTFNVEGNITEAQHRLLAIIETGISARMVVVLGVDTGCFTKCAPAKPRRAEDEIQRKDKTATQSEVSTLRQVLIRRQSEKLTIQNAIDQWIKWRYVVREGRKLVDDFFDSVEDYNAWERTFAAWAALMISIGEEETASTFLSLLQAEILEDESASCLTREFRSFFKEHSVYMSNAGRTEFIFQLLCIASDRLIKQSDGEIQLGLSIDQYNHEYLRKKGIYRKFLENPDNVQSSTVIFP
jgi:hypothetical protein